MIRTYCAVASNLF